MVSAISLLRNSLGHQYGVGHIKIKDGKRGNPFYGISRGLI
jgi:hypothetical protein